MAPQREWFEKDYYKTLGVASTATAKEITSAYRKLAKKHHPDTNPGDDELFKEISAAYDVLGDADKRKEYDEVRTMGPAAGGFPGGFGGGGGFPGGGTYRTQDMGDLGDLFGGLFGRGRRNPQQAGPQRGADVETELHLTFEDAVTGVTTSVNVTTDARCHTCSGSGVEHRNRSVKVRLPAGVEDGKRIRVKGRGAAGRAGGPAGDLYVIARVGRHSLFGRKGKNLTLTVPVGFAEAALGTTLTVPTLDDQVTLRLSPGTPSGRTFRVKGRGVPGGKKTSAGDLLVTVEVAVPDELTDEQRAAVEELARVIEPPSRASLGL